MASRSDAPHIAAVLFGFFAAASFVANAADFPAPTIAAAGTTHNRAQVLDWIDDTRFALGRWDGTVSVFRLPRAGEFGPVVEQAWASASGRGIEMLTAIDARVLVVSDGPDRLALRKQGRDRRFASAGTQRYAPDVGTANSGAALRIDGEDWFVSGHESGRVLIWKRRGDTRLALARTVDLHSTNPIAAPYPLKNIRDLVPWRDRYLIAASEDGDIVALEIPGGREVFRRRYNADAQRGINDIAVRGDWLLVANCAVGASDRNLWLFDLSGGAPQLRDAANLALDTQRTQVFNFEVELAGSPARLQFFSSTEEGLLWRGTVDNGKLAVSGVARVAADGGAVLGIAPSKSVLAAAAHQIQVFEYDP